MNSYFSLPDRFTFKAGLISLLAVPPLLDSELPPYVKPPGEEYDSGIQNRFEIVGIDPSSLTRTGTLIFVLEVKTTSGTYRDSVSVLTTLPWYPTLGIQNVPIGIPVVMHGQNQESYNWSMIRPPGCRRL